MEFYENNPDVIIPLPRWHYPKWVYGFIVLIVFLVAYNLYALPHNIVVLHLLEDGKKLLKDGNIALATVRFREGLSIEPTSKALRFQAAKAYFSYQDTQGYELGLDYIYDLELSDEEYGEISGLLPSEYIKDFKTIQN